MVSFVRNSYLIFNLLVCLCHMCFGFKIAEETLSFSINQGFLFFHAYSTHGWHRTVKGSLKRHFPFHILTLYSFKETVVDTRQLFKRSRDLVQSWDGTVKGTVNKTVSLFRKSRWTAVHAC